MPDESPTGSGPQRDPKRSTTRHDSVKKQISKYTRTEQNSTDALTASSIGAIFRRAREAQGLSQDRVAALTDSNDQPISRTAISAIERGRYLPNLGNLNALSRVLHVDPMEVLERVDLEVRAPVDITGVSPRDLRQRAEEAFWTGDYRSALTVYDAMLEQLVLNPPTDPDEHRRRHARLEINRAVTLRRCEAVKAALASAQRAIELSEGFDDLQAEAYMALAALLSHEGLLVLANVVADQAIVLSRGGAAPIHGQAWSQKGNVVYRMGRFEEARQAFLEARKLVAKTALHHDEKINLEGNIGACLMSLGRLKQAQTRVMKAIELARKYHDPPAETTWLVTLGRIRLAQGEARDAERHAAAALKLAKPREFLLTIFRAEWLRHLVAKHRNSTISDRHRLAYLKKLYTRLHGHEGLTEIQEFKKAVMIPSRDAERRTTS